MAAGNATRIGSGSGSQDNAGRDGPWLWGHRLGSPHIPVKNMMCAFGVPGYMIHGTPVAGFSVIPVDFSVAPGMYTTYSHFAPVTLPVAGSKLSGGPVSVYSADGVCGILSFPVV